MVTSFHHKTCKPSQREKRSNFLVFSAKQRVQGLLRYYKHALREVSFKVTPKRNVPQTVRKIQRRYTGESLRTPSVPFPK